MDGLEMKVKIDDLINVFEKDLYKGCSNKNKLYKFERNKMSNIIDITNTLINGNCVMNNYNIFLIKYPKYRIVMSLKMKDKIINHYITKYSLLPKLEHFLIDRNIATRSGKGTDYGIKLIKKDIESFKKYDEFYVLKIDISKYFYNIDHNILKNMLKILDKSEFDLLCKIIDSTNNKYINNTIKKIINKELKYSNRKEELLSIPIYKNKKGLPIGNMTSQFLAIYYLYKLDYFIIHTLGIKHMIRYMDDYVLIHNDKEYLNKCLDIIKYKLRNEYKLEINNKKTKIYSSKEGFSFLGYTYKVVNKKTIIKIDKNTFNRVKKKIQLVNKNYTNNKLLFSYSSINNYYNSFKYNNSLKVKRYINRKT